MRRSDACASTPACGDSRVWDRCKSGCCSSSQLATSHVGRGSRSTALTQAGPSGHSTRRWMIPHRSYTCMRCVKARSTGIRFPALRRSTKLRPDRKSRQPSQSEGQNSRPTPAPFSSAANRTQNRARRTRFPSKGHPCAGIQLSKICISSAVDAAAAIPSTLPRHAGGEAPCLQLFLAAGSSISTPHRHPEHWRRSPAFPRRNGAGESAKR